MDRLPTVCENHQNAYQDVLDAKNAILEQWLLGRDQQALKRQNALKWLTVGSAVCLPDGNPSCFERQTEKS
jgi:hypothetical protein